FRASVIRTESDRTLPCGRRSDENRGYLLYGRWGRSRRAYTVLTANPSAFARVPAEVCFLSWNLSLAPRLPMDMPPVRGYIAFPAVSPPSNAACWRDWTRGQRLWAEAWIPPPASVA